MVKVLSTAQLVRTGAVGLMVLLSACAPGEAKEAGLGPEPLPELSAVSVAPAAVTLAAGAAQSFSVSGTLTDGATITPPVTWSANSGTISSSGSYVAPSVAGTYRVIATVVGGTLSDTSIVTVPAAPVTLAALSLSPSTVSLQTGASQQFAISALWSNGGTTLPPVSYSATGGTVNGNGLFVAGGTPGTYRVIVSHNGGTLADTASVTVQAVPPATLTNLIIIPGSATLQTGATQQFAVAGSWSDGGTSTPTVSYSATGGTINPAGVYTAGSTAGSYRVIATHAASGRADTSNVTVTAPPAATLTALNLTPASVSLNTGATQQFSLSAQWSDGSGSVPPVSYSATGGTVSAGGLYTAGSTAGTFRVIVTHAASGLADTAAVTLSVPAPTLSSLSLTPASVTLNSGVTQQFSVAALWSDGGTTIPAVTYSATGGTVSASGLYTAGSTAGTYRVIVSGSGRADTSSVTITLPAPTLTSLTLTPGSVSLTTGASQMFTVAALWSDGGTTIPAVTFSATGGNVIQNGQYTAGSTAGTFRMIVSGSGRADTSTVTISAPAATLTSLSMTPASVSLNTGATQQFAVAAQWSDGGTTLPALTYSATGGTVSASGFYTAGSTGGSFRVIAAGGGRADTSTVTLTSPTATVASVSITPSSVSLGTGSSQQFSATVTMSDGSTQTSPTLTWAATGGTVTPAQIYTAGIAPGTYRVIASSANGRADTSTVNVVLSGGNNMFFNSSEAGCGTDPNIILCDDFEDGDWYSKDADKANASGGLLQTDGWSGTIYANPITPAGAGTCGSRGAAGTSCAAHGGTHNGGEGGVNMADHAFAGGPVTELWARWYYKADAGYQFGAEKHTNFTKSAGDITWFNVQFNCGGSTQSTAIPHIQIIHGPSHTCQSPNVSSLQLQGGRWYYFEVHAKLNSSGTVQDGLIEMWINDCGTDGECTGTPTLRTRMTNVGFDRDQSGCLSSPCKIEVLWFENWANPASVGTAYLDQIKVSKAGPIGFMP